MLATVIRMTASGTRDRQSSDGRQCARIRRCPIGAAPEMPRSWHASCSAARAMATKPTPKRKPSHRSPKKAPKRDAKKDLIVRRNEYAAKFFPYIEKVARRLARRLPAHVEIDDLISSGVIGLMEAAERFDPERVDRFEAFAEFRIRGAMLDDLRSRDTLSRDMRRLSNELRDATRRLEAQLGRTPDHEEIAKIG